MTTGMFASIRGSIVAQELKVELWDYTDDGDLVYRIKVNDDIRFVEARVTDDIWRIIDMAARAYDE